MMLKNQTSVSDHIPSDNFRYEGKFYQYQLRRVLAPWSVGPFEIVTC